MPDCSTWIPVAYLSKLNFRNRSMVLFFILYQAAGTKMSNFTNTCFRQLDM
jgi:hypothetical protein